MFQAFKIVCASPSGCGNSFSRTACSGKNRESGNCFPSLASNHTLVRDVPFGLRLPLWTSVSHRVLSDHPCKVEEDLVAARFPAPLE